MEQEILEYLIDIFKGYLNDLYNGNLEELKKIYEFIKAKREEKNIEAKKLIDALILKDEEVIETSEEVDFKDIKEEMLDKFKGVK